MTATMGGRRRTGPPLPYRPIAGVLPCGRGWLVGAGRLHGTTLFTQEPELLASFEDVLDYRPSFEILALGCPVGLNEKPTPGGRACDREARRLLGWPRSAAILSAPARADLGIRTLAESRRRGGHVKPMATSAIARMRTTTRRGTARLPCPVRAP